MLVIWCIICFVFICVLIDVLYFIFSNNLIFENFEEDSQILNLIVALIATICRKKSTGDEMSMTPFSFVSMEELKQHVNKIRQDGNSSKIRQFKCYL